MAIICGPGVGHPPAIDLSHRAHYRVAIPRQSRFYCRASGCQLTRWCRISLLIRHNAHVSDLAAPPRRPIARAALVSGQVRSCHQPGGLGVPHSHSILLLLALVSTGDGSQPQLEFGRILRCFNSCPMPLRYHGEARICRTSDASETRLNREPEASWHETIGDEIYAMGAAREVVKKPNARKHDQRRNQLWLYNGEEHSLDTEIASKTTGYTTYES